MALFVTRGMSAWVAAVAALEPAAPEPPHCVGEDTPQSRRPMVALSIRAELTAFSGMVPAYAAVGRRQWDDYAGKVTAEHLQRAAYLYVRQSSLHQVHEHRESTARQYELKRRAQALGWNAEQLIVIDEDQGLSGASAAERSGFQRMVAEVGLGRAG